MGDGSGGHCGRHRKYRCSECEREHPNDYHSDPPVVDNVEKFYPKDAAKNPDAVLEQAIGEYENVMVLGWNKDGEMDIRSDTGLSKKDILFLLEAFKHAMMSGDYDI